MRTRSISIRDPWASLIRDGIKTIETRSWKTSYRGEIAIHRSSTFEVLDFAWLIHAPHSDMVMRSRERIRTYCYIDPDPDNLPRRELKVEPQIIAVAELVDCVPFRKCHVEAAACPFAPGRFAWKLDNITPIRPVKTSGRQGLFMADFQVEEPSDPSGFFDLLPNLMAVLNASVVGMTDTKSDAEMIAWYDAIAGIVEDHVSTTELPEAFKSADLPRLLISATTANYNFLGRISSIFDW